MPSTSSRQRALMCIALAIKQGKTPASYSKEGAKLAKEMSLGKLEEYCKPPVKEK